MSSDEKPFVVRRGRFDSLTVYEVTEDELAVLEKGGPASGLKDFGIALASIGISFLIAVLTLEKPGESLVRYVTFLVFAILGTVGGAICLAVWWKFREGSKSAIRKIKERLKEERAAEPEKVDDSPPSGETSAGSNDRDDKPTS